VALGLVAAAGVTALATVLPLDGAERPLWRAVGRLHPVLVHFPVALLLVVPLLEWGGRRRPEWRSAAGLLLGLGTVGAYVAVLAGLALAAADGHAGAGVQRHLWGGVAVALVATAAWLARSARRKRLYGLTLAGTVGVLGWAAHQGGNLTHGEYYLTEGLPANVRRALRLPEPPVPETYAADTVYGAAVHPVLERYCFSCHGPAKQKGSYRMDTFAALLAGGQSGLAAIEPGQADRGELLRRLALPVSDKKAMPPQGQPRPKEAELKLLRWWIAQGARRGQTLAEAAVDPEFAALLAAARPADAPAIELPKVGDFTAHREEFARLAKELDVILTPVSKRPGDGLWLKPRQPTAFDPAALARLAPLAPFVVELDLGGTRIDDTGLAVLAGWRALERLGLERTAVTGSGLGTLAELPRLERLNLSGSALTDAGLSTLVKLRPLRRLYTAGSPVTPAGLDAFRATRPDCVAP